MDNKANEARDIVTAALRCHLRANRIAYNDVDFGGFYNEIRFDKDLGGGHELLYVCGFDEHAVHIRTYSTLYRVEKSKEYAVWALKQPVELGFLGFDKNNVVFHEVTLPFYDDDEEFLPSSATFRNIFTMTENYLTNDFLRTARGISDSKQVWDKNRFSECRLWEEDQVDFPPIFQIIENNEVLRGKPDLDRKLDCVPVGKGSFAVSLTLLLHDFSADPLLYSLMNMVSEELLRFQSRYPYNIFRWENGHLLMLGQLCLDQPVKFGDMDFNPFCEGENCKAHLESMDEWFDFAEPELNEKGGE